MTFSTVTSTKNSTPPLLRYAHLMAFESLLLQNGAPVEHYLHRNGLPVFCEDPDAFLPLSKVWSFFDDVTRHEDPEIGWLVGRHVGDKKLSAKLLREVESAPTLFLAMSRMIQKISTEATDIEIGIHRHRNDYFFYMHYPGMSGLSGYTTSQTYQISFFIGLIRHFLGQHWTPDQIGIESPVVPPMLDSYLPDCRILTKQPAGFIAVPISCAHRPIRQCDTKFGSAENPPLPQESVVQTHDPSYVDSLRSVLTPYLAEGYLSQRVAAELMSSSVRSLTRRLHGYGLTYGKVIDELRFNLAKNQLQKPNMRIAEVARHVGFKDQSDFGRMIRRVSGLNPTELRNSLGSEDKKGTTISFLLDS